ncbi:MAG: polyribonucleotide nucleotidyltransferase [Planctomycetota bacterium]|jgi:polyribonucleotide nucleotidyltransferase
MAVTTVERQIGSQRLTLETGRLAKQAAGSVLCTYGETVVLVAVVTAKPREGIDFFPLTVDYREKIYAAGKFPGGFFKREGRPTLKEVLTMRMTDRPLRPLFPEGFKDEVLIQAMVLSADQQNDPDLLAVIGASAAVSLAAIPFNGPVGATRIGLVDDELVVNPTHQQLEYSQLEMILVGHKDAVNMIEVGANEVQEDTVCRAIQLGHATIKTVCDMIEELTRQNGQPHQWEPPPSQHELLEKLRARAKDALHQAKRIEGKQERYAAVNAVFDEVMAEFCAPDNTGQPACEPNLVRGYLDDIEGEVVRERILSEGRRSDGRGPTDIRPITCEVGVLPRVHGSAIFTRGETQALVATTLGTGRDEQIIDGLIEEYSKKFMLHYNFPPICVGEVRRVGAVSRREIGHGALAEKSLEVMLPAPEQVPYTVRLVSDILESNGSSSMATVCGGTLAMMDAGVPITQPVAGISIGMVHDDTKHVLLADILGEEDHFGDMDFKVAGTQRGITGIQMDLKVRGLSAEVIRETLELAKDCRMGLLRDMLSVLDKPRDDISPYAPRIITLKINPEKIGKVIGPGGKGIKGIEAETGAKVEIDDDGTINIACVDSAAAQRAREMIEAVTEEVQVGKIYDGRVSSVKDFGAFVEIIPGQDGLCHISELDTGYVKSVSDVCKIGDRMRVKVILIDDQGRVKLSRKAALREEGEVELAPTQ